MQKMCGDTFEQHEINYLDGARTIFFILSMTVDILSGSLDEPNSVLITALFNLVSDFDFIGFPFLVAPFPSLA